MDNYGYLFDEIDINTDKPVDAKIIKRKTVQKMRLLSRSDDLRKFLPEIQKGYSYHLISSDNFGANELLKVLIERIKPKIIYITTWSYNEDFIDICKDYMGDGGEMYFCVDVSIKNRKAHLYAQIVNLGYEYKNLKIRVHYMLHSKIMLIANKELNISIEGSANFSKNQRIENFTISESKDLYMFHQKWMTEIVGG